MGMYTEFHFNAELREELPKDVVHILRLMVQDTDDTDVELPDHPLFQSPRWQWMLCSDSYYFAADTHSTLRFDDIEGQYYLCIRCNLQNWAQEIQNFVDWVTPYLDAQEGDFLGFRRYEEWDEPTLLFHPKTWREPI